MYNGITHFANALNRIAFIALAQFLLMGLLGSCPKAPAESPEPAGGAPSQAAGERTALSEINFDVSGMYCEACAGIIAAKLESLDGVAEAVVDYDEASAIVVFDPAKLTAGKMIETIGEMDPYSLAVRQEGGGE